MFVRDLLLELNACLARQKAAAEEQAAAATAVDEVKAALLDQLRAEHGPFDLQELSTKQKYFAHGSNLLIVFLAGRSVQLAIYGLTIVD